MKIGDVTVTRTQFTRRDEENSPECDNKEYLEYENRTSGISKGIISYGYQRKVCVGENDHCKCEWLKIYEAKDVMHVLSKFPKAHAVEKVGYGMYDFDGFAVFSQDGPDRECLGTGETQAAAWEQAAT